MSSLEVPTAVPRPTYDMLRLQSVGRLVCQNCRLVVRAPSAVGGDGTEGIRRRARVGDDDGVVFTAHENQRSLFRTRPQGTKVTHTSLVERLCANIITIAQRVTTAFAHASQATTAAIAIITPWAAEKLVAAALVFVCALAVSQRMSQYGRMAASCTDYGVGGSDMAP